MKRLIFIIFSYLIFPFSDVSAIVLRPATIEEKNVSPFKWLIDGAVFLTEHLINILAFILIAWITLKLMRMGYEIFMS